MTKEQRQDELEDLIDTIELFCHRNDIRLGQLIHIIQFSNPEMDLFTVENKELENLVLKLINNK